MSDIFINLSVPFTLSIKSFNPLIIPLMPIVERGSNHVASTLVPFSRVMWNLETDTVGAVVREFRKRLHVLAFWYGKIDYNQII